MALLEIRSLCPGTRLGVWKIQETEAEFYHLYPSLYPFSKELSSRYHNECRRVEFLAVRALVHEMAPDTDIDIQHNSTGKPLLPGWNISISHTRGFAAVILSQESVVGVDIEYFSDRVKRVASRFIRPDEMALDLPHQLIHWSAKETVYKYDSEEDLRYKEMRLEPFQLSDGYCLVDNLKSQWKVKVFFEVTSDYVLTFTYGAHSC